MWYVIWIAVALLAVWAGRRAALKLDG